MKSTTLTSIATMTLFAALALPLRVAAQEQQQQTAQMLPHYTVTDLGTLGGTFGQAFGINNKGEVVGWSTLPGDTVTHAFLWRKGLITDLGAFGGTVSVAYAINERSEVVGTSETSVPDPLGEDFCAYGDHLICLPFLWRGGVMTALPTLGGDNPSSSRNHREST
jgi:probable HAF family extracellular repeat protein